jgi:hypothetical protein
LVVFGIGRAAETRVIVARHCALHQTREFRWASVEVAWVYEVFITTLPTNGFLVEDVLDPIMGGELIAGGARG